MTRRHFAYQTLLSTALAAQGQNGHKPMGIAQWGRGHSHATGKMAAIRSLPALWEVIGFTEDTGKATTNTALDAAYQGLKPLSGEEMLTNANVRVVAMETALENTCTTAMRCLEHGKHIHLDKPGAADHAAFREMRLYAEKHHLIVQMGYMLRYNPAFQLLQTAVERGWLGEITEIDAAMGKQASPAMRRELLGYVGGGMFELAGHIIDRVVAILGEPKKVASFGTKVGNDGLTDNQLAVFTYEKALATIRCNHADPFGNPRRFFNVTGTEGSLKIAPLESGKVELFLTRAHGHYKAGRQEISLEVPKGRYDGEFIHLAEMISKTSENPWTAAHDIAVHRTLLAAAGV